VPYNGLTLDTTQAAQLTAAYGNQIKFRTGANPFIINEDGTTRPIKANELVLLDVPQDSIKCAGWGSVKPIPDRYVLSETEITDIRNATAGYNEKLRRIANENGLAFADANAYLKQIDQGLLQNATIYSSEFVSGGVFSLDGIHLSPKGNAIMANLVIRAINERYNARIPAADLNQYSGNLFP
ncbi:MAG: hypothetical protein LPK19_12480, partial [Hymenobacteraceae bacterium]|nr:hypothetical protein [Hymenobacteraceae bacterium]MDX5397047.1 hypothetical protein [Hymenobacteraceae bacterium]MDX5513118.1 hypothetical protein [Hymenobacteraceae bacterium]